MIVAVLMGRKGSQGYPGKNLVPVLGRPLCAYPMLAAVNAPSVDALYVTTDDEAIRTVARAHGAVLLDRPPQLASSQALGEHVFVQAYQAILEGGVTPELVVLLMCNAATIVSATIEAGIAALRADPGLDSAVSVSRYNMWSPLRARRETSEGLLEPFVPFETFGDPATLNCDRDSQGDVWFADMGVSIVRPGCLDRLDEGLLPQKWMGRKIFPLKQWGGCDVDYPWQVPGVEYWLRDHGFSETATPYGGVA
jgi:molybdopterin-guanine dinucleotide biosynthesis protein A